MNFKICVFVMEVILSKYFFYIGLCVEDLAIILPVLSLIQYYHYFTVTSQSCKLFTVA